LFLQFRPSCYILWDVIGTTGERMVQIEHEDT
jgi:hypothetical protein